MVKNWKHFLHQISLIKRCMFSTLKHLWNQVCIWPSMAWYSLTGNGLSFLVVLNSLSYNQWWLTDDEIQYVRPSFFIVQISILIATAAAKAPQSCPTLCNPINGSPPGSPVPGILQARTLEWGATAFSAILITFLLFVSIMRGILNSTEIMNFFLLFLHFA